MKEMTCISVPKLDSPVSVLTVTKSKSSAPISVNTKIYDPLRQA
jgi:hypothetical protein